MDNLSQLINLFSQVSDKNETSTTQEIPKEILDQYPYGKFPIRYTRTGQDNIRRESENRFSYTNTNNNSNLDQQKNDNFNMSNLIPLIQLLSGKIDNKDIFQLLSNILFKDNKEIQNIFSLFNNNSKTIKSQELEHQNDFPNTNKVKISSLQRIK